MTYSLTTLDQGHIILMTEYSDFNAHTDMHAVLQGVNRLLADAPSQVVIIFDARAHTVRGMGDLLPVGSLVSSETGRALICHPKLVKVVTVTSDKAAQSMLKGINSAMFGFVEIGMFPTLDEATNYAHWLIFKHRSASGLAHQRRH